MTSPPSRFRWAVTGFFAGFAIASFVVAYLQREDATALQIWLGVGLSLVTAAAVDFVALLEARRQAKLAEAQFRPVAQLVLSRVRQQRRDLYTLVKLGTGEEVGDQETLAERLFKIGLVIIRPGELKTTMFPPLPKQARVQQFHNLLQAHQRDLEALSASGFMTTEIQRLTAIVISGDFMKIAEAYSSWTFSEAPFTGVGGSAAQMVDELHTIGIPIG